MCWIPEHQPVPVGVAGELHIGGAGLARGYWQRPELTAERFIPDPFGLTPGQRLYRTGDLVRYLEDGELEYLGRLDQQVKVRGHRIELGEIEAVLGQHERVRQSVVVAREDVPGQKQLVAYVVSAGEQEVSAGELRSYLGEQLPEYMVPAFFVGLAELPLTLNGKVDRRALPAPEHTRAHSAESYVAARTPVEELLAAIWCEVLGVEQVGVHDNFFHLGGHSLLATQVSSRLRETFQVELPLRALFEYPSVAGLACRWRTACERGRDWRRRRWWE
jgi:acyl carrier protein